MIRRLAVLALLLFLPTLAGASQLTLVFNYFRHDFNNVAGFRLYQGETMVAEIPKSQVTVDAEQPYLLEETFDTDPGSKYPLVKGAWKWVASTKNMKVESNDFMIVFDKPAGVKSAISFWFWPEKALGDQPRLATYNKDMAETAATGKGAYYELRLGSSSGGRTSNFRKCYDGKYGGVDGAFGLQRYPQCNIASNQNNICQGYRVYVWWNENYYEASIYNQATGEEETVFGNDTKPLDISKLEIITEQQSFWIDNIRIGGRLDLKVSVDVDLPPPGQETTFALSAYTETLEGAKSRLLSYVVPPVEPTALPKPKGLRHGQ